MTTAFGGDATKLRIGACRVKYNSVDLGYTADGVEITIEQDWRDFVADQDGSTVLDRALIGQKATVSMKLREITATNINKALPTSTLSTSIVKGGGELAGANKAYASAQALNLHPLSKDDTDTSEDWDFPKAYPTGAITVPMGSGKDVEIPITFMCFPNQAGTRGERLYSYGVAP